MSFRTNLRTKGAYLDCWQGSWSAILPFIFYIMLIARGRSLLVFWFLWLICLPGLGVKKLDFRVRLIVDTGGSKDYFMQVEPLYRLAEVISWFVVWRVNFESLSPETVCFCWLLRILRFLGDVTSEEFIMSRGELTFGFFLFTALDWGLLMTYFVQFYFNRPFKLGLRVYAKLSS